MNLVVVNIPDSFAKRVNGLMLNIDRGSHSRRLHREPLATLFLDFGLDQNGLILGISLCCLIGLSVLRRRKNVLGSIELLLLHYRLRSLSQCVIVNEVNQAGRAFFYFLDLHHQLCCD